MKLKLYSRRSESPGVESFLFRSEKPLVWKAGQFLHYVLNHAPTDDRGSDRWFTIASAPYERHVMLTTRFAPKQKQGSTFKRALKKLRRGDTIEVSDLEGDFIVSDPGKQYVFIAGGIGITPFRAILKEAAHAGKRLRAILLYANRTTVAAYRKDLDAMARRNRHLVIHYLFDPQRLDRKTIQELVPDLKAPVFYVSGPEPMVDGVSRLLRRMGVPSRRIKQDWFPGYPAD